MNGFYLVCFFLILNDHYVILTLRLITSYFRTRTKLQSLNGSRSSFRQVTQTQSKSPHKDIATAPYHDSDVEFIALALLSLHPQNVTAMADNDPTTDDN